MIAERRYVILTTGERIEVRPNKFGFDEGGVYILLGYKDGIAEHRRFPWTSVREWGELSGWPST